MIASIASRALHRSSTESGQSNRTQKSPVVRLTAEQSDIWEHAALLFHSYDWRDSARAFATLAPDLDDNTAHTLCTLNIAMIQARLGEYHLAEASAEAAAKLDRNLVITPYIVGCISWELQQFIKAEACLKVCLRALHGGDMSFSQLGLDFVLRSEHVRLLLSAVRVSAIGYGVPPSVTGAVLPAECIFEAPPRSQTSSWRYLSQHGSVARGRAMAMLRAHGPSARSLRSMYSSSSSLRAHYSQPQPQLLREPSGRSQRSRTLDRPRKPSPLRVHKKAPTTTIEASEDTTSIQSGTTQQMSPTTPVSGRARSQLPPTTYHGSWRKRPSTPYVARDAHGEYGSTRHLTAFIRRREKQGASLEPREARAEAESTRELAEFINIAGRAPRPDQAKGREGTHPDLAFPIYNSSAQHAASEPCSPRIESPSTFRDMSLPASPGVATVPGDGALELLLPAVYDPDHNVGVSVPPSPWRRKGEQAHPWNPLGQLHTAGSSASSLFAGSIATVERGARAHDAALRMLEGRGRDKEPKRKPVAQRSMSENKVLPPDPHASRFDALNQVSAAVPRTTMDSADIIGLGRRR